MIPVMAFYPDLKLKEKYLKSQASVTIHKGLQWLELHVRKPYLEGTPIDDYITKPLKDIYCDFRNDKAK